MPQTYTPLQTELVSITCPRMARIWEVRRQDGTNFYFADHAQNIVFDGNTYTPVDGFNHSATAEMTTLEQSSLEIQGILSDSKITDEDLSSGLYDDALIIERIIDYKLSTVAGELYRRHWWIDSVKWDGESWSAQLKGLASWLSQNTGMVANRTCRFNLGDADCGVDLVGGGYKQSGEITSIVSAKREFQTDVSAAIAANVTGENDQWYRFGLLTFTSATNTKLVGLSFEVYSFLETNGQIVLRTRLPFDATVGDEFDIVPGCDKAASTCKAKFTNFARFGGDPFLPGIDKVIETPSSTS